MSLIEIRAIAYAIAAVLLIACGVALGMRHVQAQWNIDKLAQASALEAQQQKVIEIQKERDALQSQVEVSHAQVIANGSALVTGVSTSLRAVEAALRTRPMPGAVVNTGAVQDALSRSGIDPKLTASFESVSAAITSLATDCVHVDADRTAIIGLEPRSR